jgi:hypothetical protein
MKASLLRPAHPERICWGCDRYCGADDLGCAGTVRAAHPCELFGEDWLEWSERRGPSLESSMGPTPIGVADDKRGLGGI